MVKAKNLPAPDDLYPIRRALLSVFDKTGLVEFAQRLVEHNVTLISTGGTARTIRDAGLPVTDVSELTNFPEILDGRVKSLHPAVHGGLLARRNDPEDLAALAGQRIEPIDLVVVNLYPFRQTVAREGITEAEAIENIDIGGPAMIRAAAKNFYFVSVVTSAEDYLPVADELDASGGKLSLKTRRRLAQRAFETTARYDRAISDYFRTLLPGPGEAAHGEFPDRLNLSFPKAQSLRYGENPHQQAALYGTPDRFFEQLHGKELSFNNLMDLSGALQLIDEFREGEPACAILKHTNPCGAATAGSLLEAYRAAFATDIQSPFGGIVVVNRPLDQATAEAIDEIFTEIVVAPGFEDGVTDFLRQKKNRRIIRALEPAGSDEGLDVRYAVGGLLVQERDPVIPSLSKKQADWKVVTRRAPTADEWQDLDFAWRVAKHVKSNAIVYAKNRATIGIGAGQMSRIDSSEIAIMKGQKSGLGFEGSAIASDAFFPFADGLIAAAKAGARAVIQPGGSVRDEEVIQAANDYNLAMVFTSVRHFRH
jgi:phosphoribosylaminoimidazolecarboxamide formyltransferase / IMP cyclohydrolase